MSLEIPTIHLNGTSKERLLEAIEEAYAKINDALKALAETAPNGRDYYIKGPDALNQAQNQHYSRIARLVAVSSELQQIAEGIEVQS